MKYLKPYTLELLIYLLFYKNKITEPNKYGEKNEFFEYLKNHKLGEFLKFSKNKANEREISIKHKNKLKDYLKKYLIDYKNGDLSLDESDIFNKRYFPQGIYTYTENLINMTEILNDYYKASKKPTYTINTKNEKEEFKPFTLNTRCIEQQNLNIDYSSLRKYEFILDLYLNTRGFIEILSWQNSSSILAYFPNDIRLEMKIKVLKHPDEIHKTLLTQPRLKKYQLKSLTEPEFFKKKKNIYIYLDNKPVCLTNKQYEMVYKIVEGTDKYTTKTKKTMVSNINKKVRKEINVPLLVSSDDSSYRINKNDISWKEL